MNENAGLPWSLVAIILSVFLTVVVCTVVILHHVLSALSVASGG